MRVIHRAKVDELFKNHPPLLNCSRRSTPLTKENYDSVGFKRAKVTPLDQYILDNYPKIVGSLIYMSITCRPDLTYAVGRLSRGMHTPDMKHVQMMQSVIGYLRFQRGRKLVYQRKDARIQSLFRKIGEADPVLAKICGYDYRGSTPITGMTDSDFANNEAARKSVSGHCFFLFGCLVSWRSKLQPLTATSTHEAELIALTFAADEGVWLRRMLTEVGFVIPDVSRIQHTKPDEEDDDPTSVVETPSPDDTPIMELEPTPILCDNKGTVFTANNPVTNLRSRHLEVRWFKVRDYVKNGLLNVLHLRTQYNLADYFTKPLLGNHFQEFRDCIMGVEPETSYFMMQLIKLQSRPIIPNPSCLYVGPGKGS